MLIQADVHMDGAGLQVHGVHIGQITVGEGSLVGLALVGQLRARPRGQTLGRAE